VARHVLDDSRPAALLGETGWDPRFSTSRVAASRMSCPNKVQKITADAVLPHLPVDQSPGREPVLVAGWPQRPPPRKASEAAHWSGVFGKPHAG